jgi:hypothetical protein
VALSEGSNISFDTIFGLDIPTHAWCHKNMIESSLNHAKTHQILGSNLLQIDDIKLAY